MYFFWSLRPKGKYKVFVLDNCGIHFAPLNCAEAMQVSFYFHQGVPAFTKARIA